MGDLDMGEQFLNFPLHPELQQYCGIDISTYLGKKDSQCTMWWRWAWYITGLKPSLYFTIKGTYLVEEVVYGNPANESNPFHWSKVSLNLPGDPSYQLQLPWVIQLTSGGHLAGGSKRYMDDW
jgi:hypothetical protein